MENSALQSFMNFLQTTSDLVAAEVSQSSFWYQVEAIIGAIILSLLVSRFLAHRIRRWEEYFSKENVSHSIARFCLQLARRLFFSIFAALFLSLGASVIADQHLLAEKSFNLINIGYQIFYAWALLVFMIQLFTTFVATDSLLQQIKKPLYVIFWILAILEIVGILPKFIQALRAINLPIGSDSLTLWALIVGAITIFVSLLLAHWLSNLCDSALNSAKDIDNNLKIVLSRLIHIAFMAVAVLISLSTMGLDLTILSVFGGAIGVGLGFGLQKIASNYISGFIILFDHSVKIGDTVEVAGFNGKITQIKTRYSVLRNFSGEEMIIPNETFVTQNVKNFTFTDRASVATVETSIGYECDVNRALAILVEIARRQSRVLESPTPWAVVSGFGNDGINLKLSFWVKDPENGTSVLRSSIMKEVLERFNAEKISIPYTIRDVTLKGELKIKAANDSAS
ncbi:mechanosensitive ion channel family protein [Parasutterella secunda]|uniref:Mechanosensitive ion channel n=1 Tax=Parasutterella secunda TaxID=626947 RepID=A0ABS2GUU5_9BURK|nr:mechanosensitive ion channel domain-containing protein [Parasutterella secunda]MBM6929226.1 mechanosensitive ion channel [Parasutterella secunda]